MHPKKLDSPFQGTVFLYGLSILVSEYYPLDQTRNSGYPYSVIKSFSDKTTKKLFLGEPLNQKERRVFGAMNVQKATERLFLLDSADEKALLTASALHYHKLHGSGRCSIDADSRKSKWRITFTWENDEATDVCLVKIEDTH